MGDRGQGVAALDHVGLGAGSCAWPLLGARSGRPDGLARSSRPSRRRQTPPRRRRRGRRPPIRARTARTRAGAWCACSSMATGGRMERGDRIDARRRSGGRNFPDRCAQALGRGRRIGVGGDAARGGDQRRGAARREGGARAAPAGRPGRRPRGSRKIARGISSRRRAMCSARWRRRRRPSRSGPPSPGRRGASPSTSAGEALVQRALRCRQVLEVGGARGCWCGPGRRSRRRPRPRPRPAARARRAPSSGLAVKASAPSPAHRAPGGRRSRRPAPGRRRRR